MYKRQIIDARFAKPLDENLIWQIATEHEVLITIEEGSKRGIGTHESQYLIEKNLLDSKLKKFKFLKNPKCYKHDGTLKANLYNNNNDQLDKHGLVYDLETDMFIKVKEK